MTTPTETSDITKDAVDITCFNLFSRLRFGTLNVPEDEKLVLTVGSKNLDATNITEEDAQWLDQQLEVAYYSENNVKTTDISVRNSKYTKAFLLNFDMNKVLGSMAVFGYSKPYKLNLYKSGCFFANHRDTNRPGLLGTLVVVLPTEYVGGELIFEGFNVDSYQKNHSDFKDKSLRFIYFDTELEHSVSEVISGYRITIVYNVFDSVVSSRECNLKVDLYAIPKEWSDDLYKYAFEFCTGKKNVLFGDFKYRNDVYENLIDALKTKFEVIEVGVEENRWSVNDIKDVKKVHVMKEDDEESVHEYAPCFDDYIVKTYNVEHVLFPSHSEFDRATRDYYRRYGYRGNSPISESGEIEYLKACLINPAESNEEETETGEKSGSVLE